ncbi:MAG: hypothetical protein Kow0069_09470 [Promethearchaeota archaeon]
MHVPEEVDLVAAAKEIVERRKLPYLLIVEKVDGDLYYTRNSWGSQVVYRKVGDEYELVEG